MHESSARKLSIIVFNCKVLKSSQHAFTHLCEDSFIVKQQKGRGFGNLFIHLLTDWQVCILDWAVIPPSSHYHPSKYLTFIAWLCIPARERLRFQTAHWPGSPGVCVDVERRNGSSKEWRRLKEPHLHIGARVPLVLTIHYSIVSQSS